MPGAISSRWRFFRLAFRDLATTGRKEEKAPQKFVQSLLNRRHIIYFLLLKKVFENDCFSQLFGKKKDLSLSLSWKTKLNMNEERMIERKKEANVSVVIK